MLNYLWYFLVSFSCFAVEWHPSKIWIMLVLAQLQPLIPVFYSSTFLFSCPLELAFCFFVVVVLKNSLSVLYAFLRTKAE